MLRAPVRQSAARDAVQRFYFATQWLIVAVVFGAAFLTQPDLNDKLSFYAVAAACLAFVLVLTRVRWLIRDEATRLSTGMMLSLVGIAAVLLHEAPRLDGLLVTFVATTTAAWLLLPMRRAIWTIVLASLLSFGIVLLHDPGAQNVILASALSGCFYLSARIAEIATRVACESEAEAAASSGRDELTQIPARHAFLRHAEQVHAEALEGRIPYAIEMIDINNLRYINDTYGFPAGDRAVIVVAQALQRLRGPDEYLARYDGDKFIMLIPRLDGDRAEDLGRKIRAVVFSTTINVDTEVVRIKANVGIARFPIAGVTLNALISAAERDMKLDQQGREKPAKKPIFRRRSGKISA